MGWDAGSALDERGIYRIRVGGLNRRHGVVYLVTHNVAQQHDMSRINAHTVTRHGILDFVDNLPPSSFDTEYGLHFHDMIRSGLFSDDT